MRFNRISQPRALRVLAIFGTFLVVQRFAYAEVEFAFGIPERLATVNSNSLDFAPFLTADGLALFFTSDRPGGEGGGEGDIWGSYRESDAFGEPISLGTNVNTRKFEGGPSASADGLSLYFRRSATRTSADGDLWVATRETPSTDFGPAEKLGLPVSTDAFESGASISSDGLSLFFYSDREGGFGRYDLWMATRETAAEEFTNAANLGATVNGRYDDHAASISSDGLSLFFTSTRRGGFGGNDLWMTTRETLEDEFRTPVNLGPRINDRTEEVTPNISSDGSMLMFAANLPGTFDYELWKVPILPLEPTTVTPGDVYVQNFDEALPANGNTTEVPLPDGWTATDTGAVFETSITKNFPVSTLTIRPTLVLNAGVEGETDRALAIGVPSGSGGTTLQFLADVSVLPAAAFRLQFDVEVWDASSRNVDSPGEAAFDVTLELDAGLGFGMLADLGTFTTNPILVPPADTYLDGNSAGNRASFDTGTQTVDIPADSRLRIRWTPTAGGETSGWVYGLDNVILDLMGQTPIQAGDANQDFSFDQFDLVQVQVAAKYLTGESATWGEGDWNGAPGGAPGSPPAGDGVFNQLDIVAAQQAGLYLAGPYTSVQASSLASVPEPSSLLLLGVGVFALALRRCRVRIVA